MPTHCSFFFSFFRLSARPSHTQGLLFISPVLMPILVGIYLSGLSETSLKEKGVQVPQVRFQKLWHKNSLKHDGQMRKERPEPGGFMWLSLSQRPGLLRFTRSIALRVTEPSVSSKPLACRAVLGRPPAVQPVRIVLFSSTTQGATSKERICETKASFLMKTSQTSTVSRNNPRNETVINVIRHEVPMAGSDCLVQFKSVNF